MVNWSIKNSVVILSCKIKPPHITIHTHRFFVFLSIEKHSVYAAFQRFTYQILLCGTAENSTIFYDPQNKRDKAGSRSRNVKGQIKISAYKRYKRNGGAAP